MQAKRHIYSNQKEGDVLVCNVQCLPKKGTCTSKLIAAKPSFEETLFEIPGVSGQEAVLPEQIDIWKKWRSYRKMMEQKPAMTVIL